MDKKKKPCGQFRRCLFDGIPGGEWIIVLHHPHAEGDAVLVARRNAEPVEIVLGKALYVELGGKPVENCWRIAKQELRAMDRKAIKEVAELEKMFGLKGEADGKDVEDRPKRV